MSQQANIYRALKNFLFKKNYISQAIAEMEQEWCAEADEAYKSYATHRLSISFPLIPINLAQVPHQILADDDWYLPEADDEEGEEDHDSGLDSLDHEEDEDVDQERKPNPSDFIPVPTPTTEHVPASAQEPEDPKAEGLEKLDNATEGTKDEQGTAEEGTGTDKSASNTHEGE